MDNAAWRAWEPPTAGQTMRAWHDGRCAMCGPLTRESLMLDHCHETGLVRGLLCHSCNISEGLSSDPIWEPWRSWDNPAHAFGWVQVYFGRGGTPISPRSPLYRMDADERTDWWDEQIAAAVSGNSWPTPMVLSAAAVRRAEEFERELDRIAEMLV